MGAQGHEVGGVRNAAGVQQHRIGDRKDGDVGANAQSQSEHGHDGEARRLGELPDGVTKFLRDGMHGRSPNLRFRGRRLTESQPR